MTEAADRRVAAYSKGMRQRIRLAQSIAHRPVVLVLDEPLNGLDAPTTAVFKEVLKSWATRGGAVLYTSHLLDVAERVCDRIAVLDHGRLVGIGTLDELRALAGRDGTLEQVFGALTHSEDPRQQAERLLG
jgi:ABC-2 type transport system ATP-binding protein